MWPSPESRRPATEQFVRGAEGEAQDAGRDRARADDQRPAQVMRDQQAGGKVGDQSREAEGAREHAQREVIDADGAPDVRQQHRKGADRERVAEDEEAEKDDRPGHGSSVSEWQRPGTGIGPVGVAEAVRFELTKGVNPCRFSRPVP